MESDVIEQLIGLQNIDRVRDRLQKKLDQIPVKLKGHTDGIAQLELDLEAQLQLQMQVKAEADRAELEVKTFEARREKIKVGMNAPKLSAREYTVLQEELAGVLADINSFSDVALKGMDAAGQADTAANELREQLKKAQADYTEAKEQLEGSLSGVTEDKAKRDTERAEYLSGVDPDGLEIYERVRRKHSEALSIVDGTIDRDAGRIGNDLHCSACYITITANDAVNVLARKAIVRCKSCARILYVP